MPAKKGRWISPFRFCKMSLFTGLNTLSKKVLAGQMVIMYNESQIQLDGQGFFFGTLGKRLHNSHQLYQTLQEVSDFS
jgi:hypothetical protein